MVHHFKFTFLESLGLSIPPRVVTSEEIEEELSPMYDRLGLSKGRLELMTGIRSRHLGDLGLRPSDLSIEAGRDALSRSDIGPSQIGCLIHASVCRDFLEPATATVVHRALGLSPDCQVFDLSNACLGWMTAIAQVANMIELGQIEAGLVVSGEDGRGLIEATIKNLNQDENLTRQSMKSSFASLTIGSGGVAALLTSKDLSASRHRILAATSQSATESNDLCQGGVDPSESTLASVQMQTDSEAMLHAGVALAHKTYQDFRSHLHWTPDDVNHYFTHQVGSAHSKLLFEKLELDIKKDHPTFQTFGNMGSASIGTGLALADQKGELQKGEKALLMGIGSGLVCMNMAIQW